MDILSPEMNTSPFHEAPGQPALSRRDFLWQSGGGLGGLALTAMLGREPLLAKGVLSGTLHHPPKAKRVIQLFMSWKRTSNILFYFNNFNIALPMLSPMR